ncbi:MAG: amidohydrolase family protein [Gemmatimonadaceae bacterium]|nr:amidohydrolase family protein [Gemmatimonadaceae bacterium]
MPVTLRSLALLGIAVVCACRPQGGGPVQTSDAGRIRSVPATLPTVDSAPAIPEAPTTGDTVEFTVLMSGRAAGRLRQWPDSGGTVTTTYSYNDRGRGPTLTQTLKLDKAGLPVGMQLSGTNYLKVPVREMVQLAGPLLTWRNEAAAGRTRPGSGFYLPIETLPTDIAVLAKAMLLAKTKSVAILPDGRTSITSGEARTVTVAGRSLRITPHQITGLGLTPEPVWLDADGRLFAQGSSWQMVVRRGFESVQPQLLSAQRDAARGRDSLSARMLARTPTKAVAIIHANLFDAVAKRMKPSQTVIIRGDRIVAVGADGDVPLPSDVEIIDAGNRALLPGLWDMHVHVQDDDGVLHLAAGVTTVRDLANDTDELLARRARFDQGTLLGPRVLAGGFVDGPGPFAGPSRVLVSTRDAARTAVEAYAARGYEQVKVYSSLDPQLFPTIVRTAHDKGMRVSGHVPYGMTAEQFVRAGADEIQHANFLFLNFLADSNFDTRTPARFTAVARRAGSVNLKSEQVDRFIALLKERDVVVDPTLNVFEQMFTARAGSLDQASLPVATRLPPVRPSRPADGRGCPPPPRRSRCIARSFIAMERLVRKLHDAGVRLVAGTDAAAGFSLHRELELYSEAGIPNTDILYIATLGAARVMKHDAQWGSIEVGKLADLVLVDGDPSQRMRDVRRAELVMKGGVIYVPDSLYASLGVKPAPRKGAIPTREVRAQDVVCRGPAVAVRKGTTGPVPLDCAVVDSTTAAGRNRRPAARPRRAPVKPKPKP